MKNPASSHLRSGFTLMEVMTALLLMAAIGGIVVGISRTTLELGKAIIKSQAEEMEQQAFFQFLSRRFADLPGNARFDLTSVESGQHYLSDLTLQEVPMSFTWGGQDLLAKAVQISTVETRDGSLNIVLRYYENEILEGSGSDFDSTAEAEEPYAEIVLLRNVDYFWWRVMDGNDMEEWKYEWDMAGRLPLQVEVQMAIGVDGEPLRHVFWLPPKQNPEVVMRELGSEQNNQEGNPTNELPGIGGGQSGGNTPGVGIIRGGTR